MLSIFLFLVSNGKKKKKKNHPQAKCVSGTDLHRHVLCSTHHVTVSQFGVERKKPDRCLLCGALCEPV